jgi:hypothetical protein
MYLTLDQRIQRTWMQIYKNRQKFDNLAKHGQTAECQACIRRDRYLRKQLAITKEDNAHASKIIPD